MILPINKKPLVTASNSELYTFSMFTANGNSRLPFLLSRYISIAAYNDFDRFETVMGYNNNYEDYYHWRSGEISLNTFQIPNYAVSAGIASSAAKALLQNGQYVIGIWNEEYIRGKKAYRHYYMNGDYLLYGFDDSASNFYSIGWINDEISEFTVPYSEFEKAVSLGLPAQNMFWGVYFHPQTKGFDKHNVIKELREFTAAEGNNHDSDILGWRAINFLAEDIKTRQMANNHCQRKELLFLCEYIHLMSVRIDYMLKLNIITDESLVSISKELELMAKNILNSSNLSNYITLSNNVSAIAHKLLFLSYKLLQALEEQNETAV